MAPQGALEAAEAPVVPIRAVALSEPVAGLAVALVAQQEVRLTVELVGHKVSEETAASATGMPAMVAMVQEAAQEDRHTVLHPERTLLWAVAEVVVAEAVEEVRARMVMARVMEDHQETQVTAVGPVELPAGSKPCGAL